MTLHPCLYSARWLLPVSRPPLRDYAMLVDARGRIERVAPRASFGDTGGIRHVDFGEAALLPGLVNVHAHPELAMFRGALEDLPFHQWIPALMRGKKTLSDSDYDVAARWTCAESLRAGITTIGATEDSGAAAGALQAAGMRGCVFLEVFGPAPGQADDAMRELHAKLERCAPSASGRVRLGVSPHAPFSVSDALFARVARFARSEQLPIATHAAESEAEDLLVREAAGPFAAGLRTRGIAVEPRGRSTIDLLARTGVLDCAPLLIHAIRASPEDLGLIAAAGAAIAHCPIANARLGHGIAPLVVAPAAGIPVALGTDSVASNNRLDLLEEAHAAQALQRARLQSGAVFASDELLRMVTIDAARALGVSDRVGSLDEGKDADFCVVRLDTVHAVPVADPLSALFHAARGSDVLLTAVGGHWLFTDGRVTTLDEAALETAIGAIAARLAGDPAA
jgi:5-methylthioadenosine/S-adenosylhomocysteine deaminase